MVRVVQIESGTKRRVAVVCEPFLRCLEMADSVHALAIDSIRKATSLSAVIQELAVGEELLYDDLYAGRSDWRLLPPIDVAASPGRLLLAGTGLTHLGSAQDRQAMHARGALESQAQTDSMRMYELGRIGGRPKAGQVGAAPEWFYKGNGTMVRRPFDALTVPSYAEDGGEEAEVAGVYVIGDDTRPYRVGMCAANEFSDHRFERRNYLNLAGSKLRECSLGPELLIGGDFKSVSGEVSIVREGNLVWRKTIHTGEDHMCHSLMNLEHHHFKFARLCIPGDVHVHFYGASALSFGDGVELQDWDSVQIQYEGFGRALHNTIRFETLLADQLVIATPLS